MPNIKLIAAVGACVAALGFMACGEGGGGGKKGGSLTIAEGSNPDSLDPGLASTVEASVATWLVYPGLVTYKHAEGKAGSEVIPAAAEALPKISPDRRMYTFTLRRGLKYSDGTATKASDFERAIQRALTLEWGSASFLEDIVGVKEYVKAKQDGAHISGISADDAAGKITIELTKPDDQFLYILAYPAAGLVPGKTLFKNLTNNPPAGLGAYKFTSVDPNRQYVLEKNTNFALPGIPKGNVDRITVKLVKNLARETQDVIDNKLDWMFEEPSTDLLPEVRAKYRDRYEENVANSTYYFFLNVKAPPFDKLAVRQAANYAIDKRALVRIFGGLLEPDCNFLPPNMTGYTKIDRCPWGDPNAAPDVERAKQLIKQAGAQGAKVTVWGNDEVRSSKITQYYADVLNRIGLDAKPKIIGAKTYFQTITNLKTHPQTGFTNWSPDFPHPANFFFMLNGETIQPTNNPDISEADDKAINAQIGKLKTEPAEPNAAAWAQLDRKVTGPQYAFIAAYGHSKGTTFMSQRMNVKDCSIYHPVYGDDWSQFCLK